MREEWIQVSGSQPWLNILTEERGSFLKIPVPAPDQLHQDLRARQRLQKNSPGSANVHLVHLDNH